MLLILLCLAALLLLFALPSALASTHRAPSLLSDAWPEDVAGKKSNKRGAWGKKGGDECMRDAKCAGIQTFYTLVKMYDNLFPFLTFFFFFFFFFYWCTTRTVTLGRVKSVCNMLIDSVSACRWVIFHYTAPHRVVLITHTRTHKYSHRHVPIPPPS